MSQLSCMVKRLQKNIILVRLTTVGLIYLEVTKTLIKIASTQQYIYALDSTAIVSAPVQYFRGFLANVNSLSSSVSPSSVVCLSSVVCNVRAPYSGCWNFRQCFYAIWYLGHLRPFDKNVTKIVPGEPLRREINQRGVAKYSDLGHFQGYI